MNLKVNFKKYMVLLMNMPNVSGFTWAMDTDDEEEALNLAKENPLLVAVKVMRESDDNEALIEIDNQGLKKRAKVEVPHIVTMRHN